MGSFTVSVGAVIQFTFSKNGTSFKYQAFEINGVLQNQFIAGVLLGVLHNKYNTLKASK